MATFGEQLAAARQAAGLSQHALAKAAKVDASYVNRLERGERQAPGVDLIRQFATVLNLGPEQTDTLVVAGGGLPAALEQLGPLDPTLLLLATALTDAAVPQARVVALRRIITLLTDPQGSAALDRTLLLLIEVLADPTVPRQERDDLRQIIALLLRRWRPETVA